MRKKRFSEEQIAMALRQGEAGTPVAEIIRKPGISEQTFDSRYYRRVVDTRLSPRSTVRDKLGLASQRVVRVGRHANLEDSPGGQD
jgi:hypothetical protein